MKKLLAILLTGAICLSLAGCSHEHNYVDNYCEKCGRCICEDNGHNFKPATCKNPETCSVCGATQGSTAPHDMKPATCEAPKTCKTCGYTEGEAEGHSRKLGTCSKCGKIANESQFNEIYNCITYATFESTYINKVTKTSDHNARKQLLDYAQNEINTSNQKLEKAYDVAKNYDSKLADLLKNAINKKPSWTTTSNANISKFLEDYVAWLTAKKDVASYITSIL